jgi:hypothetical protein
MNCQGCASYNFDAGKHCCSLFGKGPTLHIFEASTLAMHRHVHVACMGCMVSALLPATLRLFE